MKCAKLLDDPLQAASSPVNQAMRSVEPTAGQATLPLRRSEVPKPRRRMGRPSLASTEQLDREILDIAAMIFFSKGYSATSMAAVASAARVSKATLYLRYANKEALFRAVIEDRSQQWSMAAARMDWLRGNTLEQRLRHCVANVVRWALSADVRAFDQLLLTAPVDIAQPLKQSQYDSMVEVLATEITKYARADKKQTHNPRRVAFDLLALLTGWLYIRSTSGPISESEALRFGNHAVDLVLAARSSA